MSPLLRCSIEGRTARFDRNVPLRLVRMMACQSSSVSSIAVWGPLPWRRMPADATRMSMRPKRSKTRSAMRVMSSSRPTSRTRDRKPPPPARRAGSSVWPSGAGDRPTATTLAPARARATQTARPMPLLPPVTIATLSANGRSAVVSERCIDVSGPGLPAVLDRRHLEPLPRHGLPAARLQHRRDRAGQGLGGEGDREAAQQRRGAPVVGADRLERAPAHERRPLTDAPDLESVDLQRAFVLGRRRPVARERCLASAARPGDARAPLPAILRIPTKDELDRLLDPLLVEALRPGQERPGIEGGVEREQAAWPQHP